MVSDLKDQLLTFIHKLSKNLDRKKQTEIAIIDFSKAFDKVPHSRFSTKIGLLRCPRKYPEMDRPLSAFLSNSSQHVVIEGEASDTVGYK